MKQQKDYFIIITLFILVIIISGCVQKYTNPSPRANRNITCQNMDFYSNYFTFSNAKLSVNQTYYDAQKEAWIKSANNSYGYLGNIKIVYNVTCTELNFGNCTLFSDRPTFKITPELNCNDLKNTYLCKEEKSMFPPGKDEPSIYSPYFSYYQQSSHFSQKFLLIIQIEDNKPIIKNTLCTISLFQ